MYAGTLFRFMIGIFSILLISGCGTTIKTVITSDPQGAEIYTGASPSNMSYRGKTPRTFTYKGNQPHWKEWYYKIKKTGYEDSEIIFSPQGAINADRYVHATLKPLGERDAYAGFENWVAEEKKVLEPEPEEYTKTFYVKHNTTIRSRTLFNS